MKVKDDNNDDPIRKKPETARKKQKDRVTIYFDTEILDWFKKKGKRELVGYQTLMNDALRDFLEAEVVVDLKEDILRDKEFLRRLKSALAV